MMTKTIDVPKHIYSILLRSGQTQQELEILRALGGAVSSELGDANIHVRCVDLDDSHPVYLKCVVILGASTSTAPFRIPHSMVLLVTGSQESPAETFLKKITHWGSFRTYDRVPAPAEVAASGSA